MPDTNIRIGIVGLGNIGRFHAEHVEKLSADYDAELAVGMDVDPDVRERFSHDYGVPVVDDDAAVFDEVDAVVVTTPNRFHEEYAVTALEADCHVLVEKPIAHTLESAKRIAEAARTTDDFCMVGFHNRFHNPVQVLKSYVDEGRFGEIQHVEANYVRRRGIPGRGTWFTDEASAGGGAMIDIGTHAIDLAMYLLGFPRVEEVTGTTRSLFGTREDYTYLEMWGQDLGNGFDVDDSASAFVRCADGATVSLEVAWASNRTPTQEFVVRGTDAGATIDLQSGDLTIHEVLDEGASHFTDADVTTHSVDAHLVEDRKFVEAVTADEKPDTNTAEEALAVQEIVDAVYRSSADGRAVEICDEGITADD